MSQNQDIVVTNLNISSKEQQLKQRFLSNTRPDQTVKASLPVSSQPEIGLNSFLQEMQNTLKQQTTETMSSELVRRQASIMQQQVDLIREEQKNFSKVIKQMTKPAYEDPKKLLAEMLAPLNKQILEVKNYYEEAKLTAKDVGSQLNDIKSAIVHNKPFLQSNVEDGMSKFAKKKAIFESKIKEAENMVSDVIAEAEDKINIGGCKQGIEYLRQQIEAVSKDTEKIEIELQNRFKKIILQAQKVKNLPSEIVFSQESTCSE